MKYIYIGLIALFLLFTLKLLQDFLPLVPLLCILFLPTIILFILKKLFPADPKVDKRYQDHPFQRNWLSWTPLWRTNKEFEEMGINATSRRTLFVLWIVFATIFGLSITAFHNEFNQRLEKEEQIKKIEKEKMKGKEKKLKNNKT